MFGFGKSDNPFCSAGNTTVLEASEEAVEDTLASLPRRHRRTPMRHEKGHMRFEQLGARNYPHRKLSGISQVEIPRIVFVVQKQHAKEIEREEQISFSRIEPLGIIDNDSKLRSILSQFILTDSGIVIRFLKENTYLIDLILDARAKLADFFGDATPLRLELVQYPDEGTADLYLFVQTSLTAKETLPVLDQFEEEWWLDALPRARCKMTIKLEYI